MSDADKRSSPQVEANGKFDEKPDEEEIQFIPNRVFVNHLDSYHGRQIAFILTDKLYRNKANEETGEEEAVVEEEVTTPGVDLPAFQLKYEVVGTAKSPLYKPTEDVTLLLHEQEEQLFMKEIMKCGYVVYDITNDPDEIPKALATIQAISTELEKVKDEEPKKFKSNPEQRVFVLISSVMTWAKTRPIDPEDPDVPFVETDFRKRKPHPNYKPHIDLEKEVIQKGKKFKEKLMTVVIATGITYGVEEEDLHFLFKLAWNNEPELPIIQPGNNTIPLLNVKDLVSILFGVFENVPKKPKYIVAVEQTPSTQKQICKVLAKTLGSDRTKFITKEESFLYQEMTQAVHERLTVNLKMEPNYIVNDLELQWQSDLNFCENINKIVKEFREARKLQPIKMILHGPPAVGKTTLAQKLCEFYKLHYISVASLIKDTLSQLRTNIDYGNALIKAKADKQAAEGADEEIEEEEEDEEDLEAKMEEWREKIKEIERGLDESADGKLPDNVIIQMMKEKLSSNPCQNQGYVLDGYPKTAAQTKEIFEIGEESAEEEEAGEEEEGEEGAKPLILPHFVITLEASDGFLCSRVMALPENEIQGTHYTEEHMVRRLIQFREDNTEEKTFLNLFDEMEIHPYAINAETDDFEGIIELLKNKIGSPKGYPPSPWELEQKRLREEQIRIQEIEAAMKARMEMERKAEEERTQNMERWADLLQALQREEEELLTAQCKPFRDYLVRFIFPTLTRGLVETARVQPDDPVDFLAEFLFKENPEGRMFDPAYVAAADDLFKTIEDFQRRLGI